VTVATEPIQALPYPEPSDAPDGPNQIKALVDAVAPRLNTVYADTTARDAAILTPTEGTEAFTGTGATAAKWRYEGSDWRTVSANRISTKVTSPVSIGTGATTMSTSPSITCDGVQRVKVSAGAYGLTSNTAGAVTIYLKEDGAAFAGTNVNAIVGTSGGFNLFGSKVPTAGAHVYTLTAQGPGGTMAMHGGATLPIELLVET